MIEINEAVEKGALVLSTAKERMRMKTGGGKECMEAGVEDCLEAERYSVVAELEGLMKVAYAGLSLDTVTEALGVRRDLRGLIYKSAFSLMKRVNLPAIPKDLYKLKRKFKEEQKCNVKKFKYQNYKIFNLNNPKNYEKSIDQILKCYCIIFKDSYIKFEKINTESEEFYRYLLFEIDILMEEYYKVVNQYPNKLLVETLDYLEQVAKRVSTDSMNHFQHISELCSNCGAGFESKADLMMHIEIKGCFASPSHRCQCMEVFKSHLDWCNHWLKTDMNCTAVAWHLWRNMVKSNNKGDEVYICDGCQHQYIYFMKFWNHICYCPFFRVFILANCQFCDEINKTDIYKQTSFQENIQKAHSDKVGIKILKEWSQIPNINFKVWLAVPDDREFLKNLLKNHGSIFNDKERDA